MQIAQIVLVFLGILIFAPCWANAASYKTFYKDYDARVRTKEDYLAKLESKEMLATREEILHSARFAFRTDFVNWYEYRNFVRSDEVMVAPCTFKDARVDYLEMKPRGVKQQRRDHRQGELCLRHQGGDRITLLCGQGVMDPRREYPTPQPTPKVLEEKAKERLPEKPRLKISGPVKVAEVKTGAVEIRPCHQTTEVWVVYERSDRAIGVPWARGGEMYHRGGSWSAGSIQDCK